MGLKLFWDCTCNEIISLLFPKKEYHPHFLHNIIWIIIPFFSFFAPIGLFFCSNWWTLLISPTTKSYARILLRTMGVKRAIAFSQYKSISSQLYQSQTSLFINSPNVCPFAPNLLFFLQQQLGRKEEWPKWLNQYSLRNLIESNGTIAPRARNVFASNEEQMIGLSRSIPIKTQWFCPKPSFINFLKSHP